MLRFLDERIRSRKRMSDAQEDCFTFTMITQYLEFVDEQNPLPFRIRCFVSSWRRKSVNSLGIKSSNKTDHIEIFMTYFKGPTVMFTTEDLTRIVVRILDLRFEKEKHLQQRAKVNFYLAPVDEDDVNIGSCGEKSYEEFINSCGELFLKLDLAAEFKASFNPTIKTFDFDHKKLHLYVNFFINSRNDKPWGITEKSAKGVAGFQAGILFVSVRESDIGLIGKVLKRLHPDTMIFTLCEDQRCEMRQLTHTASHYKLINPTGLYEDEEMHPQVHELNKIAALQVAQMLSAAAAQRLIEEYVADSIGAAHRRALVYDLVAE